MGNDVSKINVNPSNYIQGNNQMNNYSNSRNGNLMQVNNSVSTADTSRLRTSSSQVEEMDLNIEESITNTSNISMPENNSMAQIEMLEQTIAKSLENLEQQEKYLRESYNKFANAPQNSYPGLYFDGNRYLNPSEYAAVYYSRYNSYTYGVSPNNSNTNGYAAINGAKTVADSTVNLISIEEYTKMFNEYFEKTVGYDYNQYQDNLNLINQELTKLKASKYSIDQMKKQQPYLDMLNTKEYKDYVNENANNTSFSSISLSQKEVGYYDTKHIETILVIDGVEVNPAEANLIKIAMELEKKGNTDTAEYNYIKNYMYMQRYQFLTENDKLMYSYLYDTKGKKAADDYLEAIKDDLNRREGQASAEKFIKSITDENGDIETEKLSTYLKTSVKGFLDGHDNFYDGLANITATEGMISVNQYEQMYILQYLTNSKGIYIEKILETKSPEEAQRISEGIYTADGKINHQFAKENLTEEEYLKLLEKIQQDEFGILDENYQISTSIGNMAPSMLVSATANILLPGSSFALMGSTLMGLSSGGNSLNQALIDGNDLHAARMYGLCSGLSETTVGYLLGNIPYLSKVSEFSIKGILKEGLEEGIQEFVDAGMRATILGEHIELNQLGQDALKSFIYGCVTSFIMNGGQATVEFSINGVMHRYDNINDFIDGMKPYLPDDVQSQFDNTQINDTTTQTNANIDEPIIETTSNTHNTYNSKISWNDEIARANNLSQVNKYSSYILEVNTLSDIPYDIFSMLDSDTSMRIKIGDKIYKPSDIDSIMKNYIQDIENGKISYEDQYKFWNKQLELKNQQLLDYIESVEYKWAIQWREKNQKGFEQAREKADKIWGELNEIESKCEQLKESIYKSQTDQERIKSNLDRVCEILDEWGKKNGHDNYAESALRQYAKTGSVYQISNGKEVSYITSTNGARSYIETLDPIDVYTYLENKKQEKNKILSNSKKEADRIYRENLQKPIPGYEYYYQKQEEMKIKSNLDRVCEILDEWGKKNGANNYAESALRRYAETGSVYQISNGKKVSYITSANGARSYVETLDPIDVSTYLDNKKHFSLLNLSSVEELNSFFKRTGSSYNQTYGVDQGGIKNLCEYYLDGKRYSYKKMKEIVNDAKKNGYAIPSFEKVAIQKEYFELKDKLVTKGFTEDQASIILSSIDDVGACSYAAKANSIFYKFSKNPELFEELFGFPMYKTTERGEKILNSNELLLDMYLYSNDTRNGGNLILKNSNSNTYIFNHSDSIDVFGRLMLDTEQQVYMSTSAGSNNEVLSSYLNAKGLDWDSYVLIENNSNNVLSNNEFNKYIYHINESIKEGKAIQLNLFSSGTEIRMINSQNITEYTTKSWGEDGGHAVFITGMKKEGFLVSSWGKEYLIPFYDLQNGGRFTIMIDDVKVTN